MAQDMGAPFVRWHVPECPVLWAPTVEFGESALRGHGRQEVRTLTDPLVTGATAKPLGASNSRGTIVHVSHRAGNGRSCNFGPDVRPPNRAYLLISG